MRGTHSDVNTRVTADLALIAITAIWGATFFMIKDALAAVTPFWFMASRFMLATALLAPFAVRGMRPHELRVGLLVGLVLFLGYALQTFALEFTSASRAGFLTGLAVVFVPCAEALIFRARPTMAMIAGVMLSIIGTALLAVEILETPHTLLGDLLGLGCALAFSAQIVAIGRLATRVNPLQLTFTQTLTVGGVSLAFASVVDVLPGPQISAALPAIGFTAAFATAGAYYVQARAQRFTTATQASLIFALEPVFATGFALALAGERLTRPEIAGCALIVLGMLVATVKR